MILLLSLDQAKDHLRVDDDAHDADIELKIAQASAIAMEYMKWSVVPEQWTVSTSPLSYDIPYLVGAAVSLMCGELYHNREASVASVLSPSVRALLDFYRTPTLA